MVRKPQITNKQRRSVVNDIHYRYTKPWLPKNRSTKVTKPESTPKSANPHAKYTFDKNSFVLNKKHRNYFKNKRRGGKNGNHNTTYFDPSDYTKNHKIPIPTPKYTSLRVSEDPKYYFKNGEYLLQTLLCPTTKQRRPKIPKSFYEGNL